MENIKVIAKTNPSYILTTFLIVSFSLISLSCKEDEPVINGAGTTLITNSGFEHIDPDTNSPKAWTIQGDKSAASIVKGSFDGRYELYYNSTADYTVSTEQVISNLENGIYDLEFNYKNSGGQKICYVSAGNASAPKMTSLQVSPTGWTKSIVKGIKVDNGQCTIKIYSQSGKGNWSRYDNLKLYKVDKDYTFLKGGDMSQLTYIEQKGGKFYENGQEKDCFDIMKNNGFNIVRLRLYNDPGNPKYSPSKRLPAGIMNPADILNLAKRAKDAGMQLLLTFHYSDYWSNAESQYKPHEWENLSYAELKKAVYDFTYDFMTKMKAQGTTPEYVSLGNETTGGILFPDGSYHNFAKMAELFNQGHDAVKAVSADTKTMIHLPDAGNKSVYEWYFGELNKNNAQYDMIGTSYYPFWTQRSATDMREWADYIAAVFDKDIFILETGYNWNPTLPSGYAGQLSNNGPYQDIYPSSKQGQKDFLLELFSHIKRAKNGRVVGCLYWDPVMIEAPGVGWELGGANIVSNTTLFDFSGNSLESLDAFKYNN